MPNTLKDLYAEPEFLKLSPEQRKDARLGWFLDRVATHSDFQSLKPEEMDDVMAGFDDEAGSYELSEDIKINDVVNRYNAQNPNKPITADDLPDRSGVLGLGKELLSGIGTAITDQLPKDLASIYQGTDVKPNDTSLAQRIINRQEKDIAANIPSRQVAIGDKWNKAMYEGPQSFATSTALSVPGMLTGGKGGAAIGGAIGGPPGAAVGGTLGAMFGSAATTGPAFFRLAENNFLHEVLQLAQKTNTNLTPEEFEQIKADVADETTKVGLWEAGPEMASQAFTAGLLKGVGGKIFGKIPGIAGISNKIAGNALTRVGAKMAAEVGEEELTEGVTFAGQEAIRKKVGLRDTDPTLSEFVSEQAGPIAVGSLLQLGGMGLANKAFSKYQAPIEADTDNLHKTESEAGVLSQEADTKRQEILERAASDTNYLKTPEPKPAVALNVDEGNANIAREEGLIDARRKTDSMPDTFAPNALSDELVNRVTLKDAENQQTAMDQIYPPVSGKDLAQGVENLGPQVKAPVWKNGMPADIAKARDLAKDRAEVQRNEALGSYRRFLENLNPDERASIENMVEDNPQDHEALKSKIRGRLNYIDQDAIKNTALARNVRGNQAVVNGDTKASARQQGRSRRYLESEQGQADAALVEAEASTVKQPSQDIPDETALDAGAESNKIVKGKPGTTFTHKNEPIEFDYAVVDADNLIVSHDAEYHKNEAYPQDLQPRDRDRSALKLQVEKIANTINPARLGTSPGVSSGAPIVGPDLVVESGNGRSIALRKAYSLAKGEGYKRFLTDNAADFGVSPKHVESLKTPVLVRIRKTDLDRVGFAKEANRDEIARMSPLEQAISDAELITDDEIGLFKPSDDGAISPYANQSFIKRFFGKLGGNETAGMTTENGNVTKTGIDRIQAAIFAKAYADKNIISLQTEETNPDIKNILNALNLAAGEFAKARSAGEGFSEIDITGDIVEASKIIRKSRNENIAVSQIINQGEMFSKRSAESEIIAKFFDENIRSGKRMGTGLKKIAELIKNDLQNRNQLGIFGKKENITKAEALNRGIEYALSTGSNAQSQKGLFSVDTETSDRPRESDRQRGTPIGDAKRFGKRSEGEPGGISEKGSFYQTVLEKPSQLSFDFKSVKRDAKSNDSKTEPVRSIFRQPRTRMVSTGDIAYSGNVVRDSSDAAALLAHIRKSAQEETYSVTTDRNGLVLEIHRVSKGTTVSASIKPFDLTGPILSIPNAKHAYFIHNHPSGAYSNATGLGGKPVASPDDVTMSRKISTILKLKRIATHSIIIAGDRYVEFSGFGHESKPEPIRPTIRKVKLPVKERRLFGKRPNKVEPITATDQAIKTITNRYQNKNGLLLLSGKGVDVGFLNWPSGDKMAEAAAKIFSEIEKTNAVSFVVNLDRITPDRAEFIKDLVESTTGEVSVADVIEAGKSALGSGKVPLVKARTASDTVSALNRIIARRDKALYSTRTPLDESGKSGDNKQYSTKETDNDLLRDNRRDAVSTLPVSEKRSRFLDQLERHGFKARKSVAFIRPFTQARKAVAKVAREFGYDTEFFRTTNDRLKRVAGSVNSTIPDTIFLNIEHDGVLLSVAGHELLHEIKAKHPDLYQFLIESNADNITGFNDYLDNVLGTSRQLAGMDTPQGAKALEEFMADFLGDQFGNPDFYEKLYQRNPSLTTRLLKIIKDVIKQVISAAKRNFVSERYLKDLTKAQDTLADVVAEFHRREKAGKGAKSGDTDYMVVFHGTPHVWPPEKGFPHGRPRLDKIGTGEGAAAYGWGFYIAGEEGTAKSYKDTLTRERGYRGSQVWQSFSSQYPKAADAFSEDIGRYANSRMSNDALGVELEGFYRSGGNHRMIEDDTKGLLEKAALDGFVLPDTDEGSLYQLDIPEEVMPKLLDWDRPLSEQSESVKTAIMGNIGSFRFTKDAKIESKNGEQIYNRLASERGQKEASEYLASIGIPGNTHGGMSKGGTGAKYVIWDQSVLDQIALLERNGEKLDAIRDAEAKMSTKPIKQTDTPEFRRWFGKSKVVDSTGEPLRVYHGTDVDFSEFDNSKIKSRFPYSFGFHFTSNPGEASVYADGIENASVKWDMSSKFAKPPKDGGSVMPVYIKAENPLFIKTEQSSASMEADLNRYDIIKKLYDAKKSGNPYDSVIIETKHKDEWHHKNIIVFNPTQIKSATGNTGAFDPNNPDIRYSTRQVEEQLAKDSASAWDFVKRFYKNRKIGWRQESKKELTTFEHFLSVPSFWKIDALKKMFNSGLEKPDEYHELLGDLTEHEVKGARISDVKTISDFQKADKREYARFKKYLKARDQDQIGYRVAQVSGAWIVKDLNGNIAHTTENENDAIDYALSRERADFIKAGFSEQAADALMAARRMTHKGFAVLIKGLRDLKALYEKAKREVPEDLNTALKEMGDMRSFYMPRSRVSGRYKLIAKKPGSNPRLEFFDTATLMTYRQTQLENQGYTVEKDKSGKMPEDVFDMAKQAINLQAMIDEGMRRVEQEHGKDKSVAEKQLEEMFQKVELDFSKALIEQVSNIIKERGFRSHMVKRSEAKGLDVYEGYEEDPLLAITKYARNIAAGEAKKNMALKMVRAFTGTDEAWQDFKKRVKEETGEKADYKDYQEQVNERKISATRQPLAYKNGLAYIQDMLRNEEFADRVIGQIKGLAVMKYLAGRVISAPLVNLTALATSAPAAINHYAKVPLRRTFRLLGNASTDYTKYKLKKTDGMNEWTKRAIETIESKGWHNAQYNNEALSVLKSKVGKGYDTVIDKLMFTFGASEQLNRVSTILAGYNGIKEQHKGEWTMEDHEAALAKAKHASDRAHGTYGKEDYPYLARGSNPAAQVVRMFYVFRKFSHNYMLTMKEMGWDDKNAKAAFYMALSPAVIGGAGATVLMPVVQAIGKALGVDDPEEEIYKAIENEFGSTAESYARLGLAGAGGYGINIKGSLAVGAGDIPTTLWDVLGAPGSVISDVYEGGVNILKGDISKGLEKAMPLFIGNPIKAVREYSEGITTKTNSPVFYGNEQLKNTTLDAAYRFLSLNPARISTIREKQWKERNTEYRFREKRTDINAKIKRFYLKPAYKRDKADWIDILSEIKEYNADSERYGLSPITKKSIKQLVKRSFKPSKKERRRFGKTEG